MKRIEVRDYEIILFELSELLKRRRRRRLLAKIAREFSSEISTFIIGALEYLTAEAFAKVLSINLYCRDEEELKKNDDVFVLWNGSLKEYDGFLDFAMAPEGLPDIEVHIGIKCVLIETTIGQHPHTIVSELRELVRHKPQIDSEVYARILLTLLPKKDIVELNKFVKHIIKDAKCVVGHYNMLLGLLYEKVTLTIDQLLQELQAIERYPHDLIQHINNELESKLQITEILKCSIKVAEKFEKLVSRGARVLGSLILKMYKVHKVYEDV